ncbi:GNAT family N-acetyltransferase [Yoonia sp.]|uniref:GNAT family N-acetyltransferase n=1 Tax=Yoonia sp. TaxID=2212373 RepID=UPI0025FD8B33|nr:GNAT family N-acetyltransferase [Yoonia sp.]
MADVTYRYLRPTDLDGLHALVSDWDIVRQLGSWPWPADRSFTARRCITYPGTGFIWALMQDDKLIGTMGVTEGDLGYCLAPMAWGQGIATRLARLAINHAFRDPALLWINASVWHDNPGSLHVLEKLGFSHAADDTQHALARNTPTLCHHYQLTRIQWDSLRSGAQ